MSNLTTFKGLRVSVDKIGNKTQNQFPQSGDDNNANQLTSISDRGGRRRATEDTGYGTYSIPPLVSQSDSPDKLVIWGSEAELRDFELVDCQEVDAFLGNQDEDNEENSLRDGREEEGPMSISSSSTASSASVDRRRNDNDGTHRGKDVQRRIGCHSSEALDTCVTAEKTETRERRHGGLKESKSETNVFVSSLSAAALSGSLSSALDVSGKAPKTHPYPNANNSTSAQTSRRPLPVDANQNSASLHPQEKLDPFQDQRQKEGSHHKNGLSSDVGLGQRRRTGFDERVLPPRRQQLVRPLCQTEMGRARGSADAHQDESGQRNPPNTLESYSNGLNRKFMKSALREPSDFSYLYSTPAAAQPRQPSHSQSAKREVPPLEKQPASALGLTSNPSNLSPTEKRPQIHFTYRRNCSSPNRTGVESRSSTPPHSPLKTPQGSPRRQPSMFLVSRNVPGVVRHLPSGCNPAASASAQGYGNSCLRAPVKTNISTSGISKAPLNNQQISFYSYSQHSSSPKESSPSPKLKPKGVRPKIITYVRKNPQFKPQVADGPYQVSSLPSRLSAYTHGQTPPPFKGNPKDPESRGVAVLAASNLLYDKYRQDAQAPSSVFASSAALSRSIRAPGHTHTVPPAHAHAHATPHVHAHSHTAPPKLENFYGAVAEVERSAGFKAACADDSLQPPASAQVGGSSSLLRSGRGLRLGLGAVNRTSAAAAKGRGPAQGQRSVLVFSQPVQPVSPASGQKCQDNADDQVFSQHAPVPSAAAAAQPQAVAVAVAAASRSLVPKGSQSGLRPPGFSSSRLPPGRLAAFGYVRSSSVSSAHSADSAQSDPCRTPHCVSVSEEPPPPHRVTTSTSTSTSTSPPSAAVHHRGPPCRNSSLQPPSTPALPRRYLPPQPRSSPGVGRKEFQRSSEVTRSLPSSPKRLAVVPPKLQSPVQTGQRPAAAVRGSSAPAGSPRRAAPQRPQQEQQESLQREKDEAQQKERERRAEEREKADQRQEVERLQGRCELQERQLRALREELRKTSLGLEAFIVTTQHFCLKNKTTEENERKLSAEIQKIREEMAWNSMRWESLQREKAALEAAFERELQELQLQQEAELVSVEEGLRKCHSAETEHLRAEHLSEMEELRAQQQEHVEEVTVNHQAAIQELRDMHNITMATLHEEHARTMRDLRKAHEQQKMLLEEDFEKLRLSLQDQVDVLTIQNQTLRDKAKRFEEALRRSTDEQIVEALAPYQHIDKDLKSLKEIVEMKNQQIHQQDKKISDLEKVAQKNVFLEEKVQVLQQQNEDLKSRIELNLVLSRQLSEENANLQESVEKESTDKKRLSRNNEELLWRLQTSPLLSPASSPLHRSFSTSPVPSSSPLHCSSSPLHCSSSPLHRSFSTSPVASSSSCCDSPTHCPLQHLHCASPSHRATANQSPSPATPTHRAASNQNYSLGPATPTHRASANRCNLTTSLNSR